MARATFQSLLDERPWLLADGATGTTFFAMGLMAGDAPELWNVALAITLSILSLVPVSL